MACAIFVDLRAKPHRVAECAELIDRHAHNSRPLEDGCLAFDVCQDRDDPPASSSTRTTVTRRHKPGISRRTASNSSARPYQT
jgi:hypothetical protein